MNKKLYKKVILSTIITGMAASNVIPLHTFAAEQAVQNSVSQQQEDSKSYSLGPDKYKEVMEKMGASILTMDSYAQTIRNQEQTDLSKISSINGNLQANMIQHQKDAQRNATYWLDNLKPDIMKTNQNSVSYNDTFQASYDQLLAALDQKDTVAFKNELEKLYNSILKNSQEVDGLLEKLKTFRNTMAEDTRSFKDDSNQLKSILESTNAGIPLLQQQISNYNNIIKENYDKRGGYIALSVFIPPVGIPLIVTADKNIASAQQEIEQLKSRISGAEAELVILTDAKNKTEHMTATIDTAITALQNISNQWHTIGSKYDSLLKNVNNINPDQHALLKIDLKIAKDSWQDLKNYADKLYEGAKIVQNGEIVQIGQPIEGIVQKGPDCT
ncbi:MULTISPECIES: non-hemolytic enterotoxin subunit C [Bacillus]|uniref:Enterotoxin n=1 Tax=Bacillus pseudomycoides TaxID=64104 RepID=A0AAJ1Z9K5_9BACI|nr:HBL/NHE enterotoxin family protein [Bacillus pseudomycoides]EEM08378.1 Hemolytic enterotoxin [Bacillus pseudomycoides]MBD5799699.1 enterotoxin [Bacillus pseudomycoides]MCR8860938.1 alpha-helical pore-forming toxin family protein [Bacillus pseudomycoides]MDR4188007.1 HBL/NHE enterotoxin family protein [Bacillus pseudomycoides]MDR4328866.1 HBL/NHE enterotoxin family protein [Bacillus pseudomycoides]